MSREKKQITFWVSVEEKEKLWATARASGRDLSTYLRDLTLAGIVIKSNFSGGGIQINFKPDLHEENPPKNS